MEDNRASVADREVGSCPKEGVNVEKWYLRTAKLAVAVAIIKSKPPGRSGRQQAEHLATKLNSQDDAWKTKAQGLQEEVLRLRQELLLTKMLLKPSSGSGTRGGDGLMDLLSQDLTDPANESPNSENDSGCGTGNSTEALLQTPDPEEPHTRPPHPPTSPPCQLYFSAQSQGGPQERALFNHMQFLQNLCGLRKVEAHGLCLDGDGSVVWDSVCQLLCSVVSAYREARPLPQQSLLLQASQMAVQALDQWRTHHRPSVQFVTQVEDCLKELTELLLHNNQLNRFPRQEKLADCLIVLGSSSMLSTSIIHHVLSEINHLADHLWHTCQGERDGPLQFEVARYENSFYLLWVLEQLLRQGREGTAGPEHKELLGQLERKVLPLSDEFPLFALYMWRIGALLSPTSTAET